MFFSIFKCCATVPSLILEHFCSCFRSTYIRTFLLLKASCIHLLQFHLPPSLPSPPSPKQQLICLLVSLDFPILDVSKLNNMWIYHILFTYSSIDRHFGGFQFWTIINNAPVNIGVQIFMWMCVFISLEHIPRVELLGHIYILEELPNYFPKRLPHFIIISSVHIDIIFSTSLITLFIITILLGVKWYLIVG